MPEEIDNKPESNVNSTINAVAGLAKEIPVYQDIVQPSAKQVGKSLETVTKTVNIALAPVAALVWGYEKIRDFVTTSVSKKLENVPEENIVSPQPQVAVPTIEALRYTGHDENLRELYANLLATSMNKETIHKAHPGYVDIIKNITSDEALLLQCFLEKPVYPIIDLLAEQKDGKGYSITISNYGNFYAKVAIQRKDLIPLYIDNLCRLGLLEIPSMVHMTDIQNYDVLENAEELKGSKFIIETYMQKNVTYSRKIVRVTSFGNEFIKNVVRI